MATTNVEQADHLSRLFGRALHRLLGTGLDAHGSLTGSQHHALAFIASHPECTVGELAAGLKVTCPAATKLVDRLEAKRLAVRTPWHQDRRRVQITLTPDGRRRLAAIEQARLLAMDKVLAQLTRRQQVGLLRGLEALLAAIIGDAATAAALCLRCGPSHRQGCPLNRLHRALAGCDLPRRS